MTGDKRVRRTSGDDQGVKRVLRDLDGILPESIDRRSFLEAATATVATGMLAGCSSNGGGGNETTSASTSTAGSGNSNESGTKSGSDKILKNTIWRQPWKPNPTWSFAYIAADRGFWTDQNISQPNVRKGFGSPDTTRRVGTGKEKLGESSLAASMGGISQGFDLKMYAISRPKPLLTFIYLKDKVNGPSDLKGKDIALASPFAKATWPIYLQSVGVKASEVGSAKFAKEDVVAGLIANGKIDAVWASLQQVALYNEKFPNKNFGVSPLANHISAYGYSLWTNGSWLGKSNNEEYVTRVLSGYSHAGKWCMLHPNKVLDIMTNDINQALQTQKKSLLKEKLKVAIAISTSEEVKSKGFGFYNSDTFQSSLDAYGKALLDDPSKVPSADELAATGPMENADLATFSADEWKQVTDFAGKWLDYYK